MQRQKSEQVKKESDFVDNYEITMQSETSEVPSEVPSLTSNIDNDCVRRFRSTFIDKKNMAYAVCMALNLVVQGSREKIVKAIYEEIDRCANVLIEQIKQDPEHGDRTLLPIKSLIKIYKRISRTVSSEQNIEEIRNSIHLRGITLSEHTLN